MRSSAPRVRRASLIGMLRGRRQQHDAARTLVGDVGVADHEGLHRHAAHRVADEDRVVQVEGLEHAADVVGEVVDRVAGVADVRLAVPARVEGEGAEPGRGQRVELLRPHARRQRDAVAEQDRRARRRG